MNQRQVLLAFAPKLDQHIVSQQVPAQRRAELVRAFGPALSADDSLHLRRTLGVQLADLLVNRVLEAPLLEGGKCRGAAI